MHPNKHDILKTIFNEIDQLKTDEIHIYIHYTNHYIHFSGKLCITINGLTNKKQTYIYQEIIIFYIHFIMPP